MRHSLMCSVTTTFENGLQYLAMVPETPYLEAKSTIKTKAEDMVKHYLTHVFPNGYKAQIVATSREAAVRYKEYIDDALAAAIIELETSNPNGLDVGTAKENFKQML